MNRNIEDNPRNLVMPDSKLAILFEVISTELRANMKEFALAKSGNWCISKENGTMG